MSQPACEWAMRRRAALRRWNSRGLSEIVGTLMLVLIVVAAATTFSFFVASYEKTLLAQEATNHDRAMEAMNVVAVHTHPVAPGSATFGNLSLTLESADVNPMQIDNLLVNGNVVISYNLTYLDNGTVTSIGLLHGEGNSSFLIPPLQEVQINLTLNSTSPVFSFLAASQIPTANSYLVIEFQTALGNDFKTIFVPPVALSDLTFVQTIQGGVIVEIPVLDGTHSFQQGGNETIVAWDWVITDTTTNMTTTASGAQVELTGLSSSDHYAALLTVYNGLGLFSVSPSIDIQ
jgi:flagellin-like protein